MPVKVLQGDCRDVLRTLPDESVHCVVTSPPYWGLRDYGVPPSIWGGDDRCEHEWTEQRWYTEQSAAKSNGSSEAFSKPGPDNAARLKDAQWRTAATCKCGAWRGAHGLEPTYSMFVENQVRIFREVRRVLRPEGTLWLNLGDSYATGAGAVGECPGGGDQGSAWAGRPERGANSSAGYRGNRKVGQNGKQEYTGIGPMTQPNRMPQPGLKPKDLCGIPWRVAFALQADGWWLRQDIIWSKPNPMPESVRDRCTKAHEYIFLMSKSERYYYDADAIAEESLDASIARSKRGRSDEHKWADGGPGDHTIAKVPPSPGRSGNKRRKAASERGVPIDTDGSTNGAVAGSIPWEGFVRNKRSVWTVGTKPFSEAHFATFPPDLIKPCILAGCPQGGTVLDPFGGAGTTALVADREQRNAILIELNPAYADMAKRRIADDAPLFGAAAE